MTLICTYFNIKADVAQTLIDFFFLTLTVREPFYKKDFEWKKKYGGLGLISAKNVSLYAKLNERVEAAPVVIL